jgi:hypothetical protein
LTALGLHFSHQRRLGLRRPLPAALNHDLAIHSKYSFWTVQKDPASLSTLLSTTAGRPVQTGRLLHDDDIEGLGLARARFDHALELRPAIIRGGCTGFHIGLDELIAARGAIGFACRF